jgi:hypothetical protein
MPAMPSPTPEEVQDAVNELHQYLSDQKAPLMVDSPVAASAVPHATR